jgi:mannose-6-phosphate isomerase-like protein (cupin superfamily)
MEHPCAIRPEEHAVWRADKMGKSTLFSSERILVGLNAAGMDKVYQVLSGSGELLLDGRSVPATPGALMVVPQGIPHGIRNTGRERLLVLAILAPGPG